jgi:hypothetical protein
VCKALPGCQPSGETCASDKDCCAGLCRGGRCQATSGCRPSGERCFANAQCCSGTCKAGPEAVPRCAEGKCRRVGELCNKADECCDRIACRAGAGAGTGAAPRCLGTIAACLPPGAPCAVPDQCCSSLCLPDASGALACGVACAAAGAPCSSPADCCDGVCGGPSERGLCLPAHEGAPAGPRCVTVGEPCVLSGNRCCAGTLCAKLAAGGTYCVNLVD